MRLVWLLVLAACGEDPEFVAPDKEVCANRRDGVRYCIDTYEAARADATAGLAGSDDLSPPKTQPSLVPWTNISWGEAKAACEKKGKRLCELDEWVDACDGVVGNDGTTYTYGDVLDPSRCNIGNGAAQAGGSVSTCQSLIGTYDQSGNVWEWTGNTAGAAAVRGGGWASTQTHRCTDVLPGASSTEKSAEIGFRCCRST